MIPAVSYTWSLSATVSVIWLSWTISPSRLPERLVKTMSPIRQRRVSSGMYTSRL